MCVLNSGLVPFSDTCAISADDKRNAFVSAVTSKGVFNDQEKSFIFYNPLSKGKMKSLHCQMELEAVLSAWVFLNFAL